MEQIAGWIAPFATIVAAMVVAANLGPRITGWGFVIFAIGSVAWCAFAIAKGETGLLITNGFLVLVNLAGVWRWLGRQARYEEGSEAAARCSAAARRVPTLFSAGSLIGRVVHSADGERLGTIVDAMLCCEERSIAYVVIGDGGLAGVAETLRAVPPDVLRFAPDGVECILPAARFIELPPIVGERWPPAAPRLRPRCEPGGNVIPLPARTARE